MCVAKFCRQKTGGKKEDKTLETMQPPHKRQEPDAAINATRIV
jgi:hypothetical protein